MCGIAGVSWAAGGEPVAPEIVERMIRVLVHRGPDDGGLYCSRRGPVALARGARAMAGVGAAVGGQFQGRESDSSGASLRSSPSHPGSGPSHPDDGSVDGRPGAVLGHRRLSIIDLGGGHQPMSNEDGTVWIVFNGEAYNYRELRPGLEARGHRFRTVCDTETILHLYEDYGPDCVRHLRGMFAFAIWDERRGRLLLARDRLGQKPLVYRQDGGRLYFASELKALLQVPGAPREIDPVAIDDYLLYQYVPHPACMLKGYRKLPPGHYAVFEDGRLRVERYWQPPYEPGSSTDAEDAERYRGCETWSRDRWSGELRRVMTASVRLRMRSDVPFGAFLSGGIDSSIVAGLMQQEAGQPVHTFSIGFPVKQFDERHYAREAAAKIGSRHHEYMVEPDALDMLQRLIWHYDEPFADSSAIPMMYLSRVTRQEVTVALSGDGGDELFAGYERYRAVALGSLFDRLPRFAQRMITAKIWQKIPARVEQRSFRRRLKRLLAAFGQPPERRYLRWISIFDDDARRALYTDGFRERLDGHDAAWFLLDSYRECPGRDFVTRTTCADLVSYLPCDILTKVDVASMAASLEARSPFLDHRVAELAARLPLELKQKGNRGKRILVETFADLLPESIQQRGKMGFGVPIDHWFRDELRPLVHDVLLDRRAIERGLFEERAVRRLIDEHTSARWDHAYRLWALLCLELWQRTFVDPGEVPSGAPGGF
jgi:asparagine synthase (glutamine-hydrolysing)